MTHGQRRSVRHLAAQLSHNVVRHPSAPLVWFTLAAAVTLFGTFAPWLHSGSTSRSSYDLLGLLSRIGIAPGDLVSTMVRWWPLVPLLITSAVVAAWWRRTWLAVVAALLSIAYAGGVAVAVMVASGDTKIAIGAGPRICAIGSGGLLVATVWLAITNARPRALPAPAEALQDGRS